MTIITELDNLRQPAAPLKFISAEGVAKEEGTEIIELSAREKKRFQEAVQPLYERYCKGSMDIVEKIIEAGK